VEAFHGLLFCLRGRASERARRRAGTAGGFKAIQPRFPVLVNVMGASFSTALHAASS